MSSNDPPPITPNFPAELVDSIIDHTHDNPKALVTYSLVSKQWVPGSRYHLFSEVSISHNNAREFIQLLNSSQCTFAAMVQSLNIQFVSGSQRWFSEFCRRLSLLEKTTNISFLTISGSSNTVIREEARMALSNPTFAQQVTRLSVAAVIFETLADFASVVCRFTNLESLSCAAHYQLPTHPGAIHFTAPLRNLVLTSPSTHLVFEFLLLQGGVLPTVTSLSLFYLAAVDYPNVARYLDTPNDVLRVLNIKMDSTLSGVTLDMFTESIDLSRLSSLSHLVIETNPGIPPEQGFHFLTKIMSHHLHTLKISLSLIQGVARIDLLLSSNHFPALKKLSIFGTSWADVRQFLPRCDAKDILHDIETT